MFPYSSPSSSIVLRNAATETARKWTLVRWKRWRTSVWMNVRATRLSFGVAGHASTWRK